VAPVLAVDPDPLVHTGRSTYRSQSLMEHRSAAVF